MANIDSALKMLNRLPPGVVKSLEKILTGLSGIKREIDSQTDELISQLESSVNPYTST